MTTTENSTHPATPTAPSDKPTGQWTPEILLQAFKEIVTALIGVTLVFATVYLAFLTYAVISSPIADEAAAQVMAQKVSWAKDILLLLLGPAGVVLGYYFGRVPADARATQAQQQANAATAHSQQVSAQAETLVAHTEEMLASGTMPAADNAGARGAGSTGVSTTDLRRMRDELRDLAKLARAQPY